MQNAMRTLMWLVIAIVGLVILSVFIGFFLKVCLAAALLAFAYYWYTRAIEARRRNRWR